jgi:FkbM family methyltransferase
LASELTGPGGKVVAIEPLPLTLRYLRGNIEINHCTNVQIVEAAVSDNDGTATFSFGGEGTDSDLLGSISTYYGPKSTMVETAKIDSLVKKKITPAPDVIKMDIEQGELAALIGAESTLIEYAPLIFLETHSLELCADCRRLLTSHGYVVERFGSGKWSQWLFAYKA